jgi:tetratricopeptide (TPR) repeat protein
VAWIELGNTLFIQGDANAALDAYLTAGSLEPGNPIAFKGIGAAYLIQEDYDMAQEAFHKALDLNDTDAEAWYGLAQAYWAQGQDDGDAAFARAKQLALQDPWAWPELSYQAAREQQFERVLEVYLWLSTVAPEEAFIAKRLSLLLEIDSRPDEAIQVLERALVFNPQDIELLIGLADLHASQGKIDKAIQSLRRAIEVDAYDPKTWCLLGAAYRRQGHVQEAIVAYQRASDLDPSETWPLHALAALHRDHGSIEDAIAAYEGLIQLENDAYLHVLLGALNEIAGELEAALAEHRQAVALLTDNAIAYSSLASVLYKLGESKEADTCLAHARELAENQEYGYYSHACIAAIGGDVDSAFDFLAKALEESPECQAWSSIDPDFRSLRDDPRWAALMAKIEPGK